MKLIKNIILILSLSSFLASSLNADVPYYIDFKYILNSSVAGKKAQDTLKKNYKMASDLLKKKKNQSRRKKKN